MSTAKPAAVLGGGVSGSGRGVGVVPLTAALLTSVLAVVCVGGSGGGVGSGSFGFGSGDFLALERPRTSKKKSPQTRSPQRGKLSTVGRTRVSLSRKLPCRLLRHWPLPFR